MPARRFLRRKIRKQFQEHNDDVGNHAVVCANCSTKIFQRENERDENFKQKKNDIKIKNGYVRGVQGILGTEGQEKVRGIFEGVEKKREKMANGKRGWCSCFGSKS